MTSLLIATRNQNKLNEIRNILSSFTVTIFSLDDLGDPIPDVIEDRKTFKENALKKAFLIASRTNYLTLAEDSGLCIDFLHGEPGVFSARFSGFGKDDRKNRLKVLTLMNNVTDEERKARFVCAVALATPQKVIGLVEGMCEGYITHKEIGNNGFGYDPIFYYPPLKKTFGELRLEEKNKVSHRFRAMNMIKSILDDYLKCNKNP